MNCSVSSDTIRLRLNVRTSLCSDERPITYQLWRQNSKWYGRSLVLIRSHSVRLSYSMRTTRRLSRASTSC